MAASLPPVPVSLKQIQHYLKTATEHDKRDPTIAYYCRLYALQKGMELDKKSTEGRTFLLSLMDTLETHKKDIADQEAIQSEVVGQAHVEDYALKLFLYADNEDRASRFGKNVIKSFYTAGMLFDVLMQFGDLSEDIENSRKYAKWKAAYIHNCLKTGETPHAGPLNEEGDEDLAGASGGASGGAPAPIGFPQPGQYQQPPTQPQPPPSQPQPPSSQPGGYTYPSQPAPHVPPSQPTGYQQPTVPAASQPPAAQPQKWTPPANPAGVKLDAQDYQRGMKLCKYASSAMQYEDAKTAIENLSKALNLLTTGHE